MKYRVILSAACCAMMSTPHAHAQSTVLQPALLADSLERIRDTSVVREMERGVPPLRDDAPPDAHLRYALIEKRVFELTQDDGARKRAQHSFDKAKDQESANTWAHFGYGWALTHGPEFKSSFEHYIPGAATISSLGAIFGLDAIARAKRSLQHALDIDPAFEPAVLELGRLALITRQPGDVATAAGAARKAIGAGRATAGLFTQLAELEMLRGNGAAAAEAARAGVKLRPDGAAQHALGVALLAVPASVDEGGAAYMAGLGGTAFGDTALYGVYRSDVSPLLTDGDRAVLAQMKGNERTQWLQSFWERSAARAGRSLGERLAEHFARMQYALAHYQHGSKFGIRGGDAFIIDGDNAKLPFDDRGLIYVRLGKPDATVITPPGTLVPPPNESWVYQRDGKVEMYHFHKFRGGADWVLSPLEDCDPYFITFGQTDADRHKDQGLMSNASSTPKGDIGAPDRYISYLQERAKYDPRMGPYMSRCQLALSNLQTFLMAQDADNEAVIKGREAAGTNLQMALPELRSDALQFAKEDQRRAVAALKADDARPKFAAPLQAITQIYAFRGKDEQTDMTAAVLIPGERFTAVPKDGVMVYPLSLSLIVIDSVTGRIQRGDVRPSFRADQSVVKGKWFRATVDMQASSTLLANYRVVVENTANSAQGDIRSGSQEIPSFSGADLMISDLVVGEAGDGRWKRGTTEINPIPTHQVEKGKPFKLFYEIYNLPASAKYRTSISAMPKASGGISGMIKSIVGKPNGVELNFDDVAAEPNGIYGLQQVRSIGADMDPGEYDLTVTITNNDTLAKTTRKTKLIVLGPKDLKQK